MAVVTDYQSFKDYLVTFLWKAGDTVLIENLDNLIRQGEASINRDLDEELRHTYAVLTDAVEENDLPADYYAMRQVSDAEGKLGEFEYLAPAQLRGRRARVSSGSWWPIYSLENTKLLLCGPTSEGGRDIGIDYIRKAPKFLDTDESWLVEDNLDLLVYSALMHSAPFLREDERVATWEGLYTKAIAVMNENSAHKKQRGVYGMKPLPRNASGRKPRNRRGSSAYKLHTST